MPYIVDGDIALSRPPKGPLAAEIEGFAGWAHLRTDRVLADATIGYYVASIRGFLADRFGKRRVTLSRLCAGDVVCFVQRQAARLHVKRAKQLTTALRVRSPRK